MDLFIFRGPIISEYFFAKIIRLNHVHFFILPSNVAGQLRMLLNLEIFNVKIIVKVDKVKFMKQK